MRYLMFDTETANSLECPLCYDFGYSVIDENGKVYEQGSFVVADVFLDKELMATAYFADKIPQYWDDIKSGKRLLRRWKTIRSIVRDVMTYHEIDTVVAHNVRFDYTATATTQRYLTCSKWRYFFPYGTKFACTLKMARDLFKSDEKYVAFCGENNYLTTYGKPQFTAEVIYRYLTNDTTFVESHTGLEDVQIETQIFVECLRKNPNANIFFWE